MRCLKHTCAIDAVPCPSARSASGLSRTILLGRVLLLLLPLHALALLSSPVLHHTNGGLPRQLGLGHPALRHRELVVHLGAPHGHCLVRAAFLVSQFPGVVGRIRSPACGAVRKHDVVSQRLGNQPACSTEGCASGHRAQSKSSRIVGAADTCRVRAFGGASPQSEVCFA